MKIPGIERDEDGTIVIEISQTMRIVALAAIALLAVMSIWWFAIRNEQKTQRQVSRVPGNIPLSEEFSDAPEKLLLPEETIGVGESLLNIERLAGADREELEKIFTGILEEGSPNLQSEEMQLYNGMIARSAQIAPNRALRFYDRLEGNNQRPYSIAQLYRKWIQINPAEAIETAKLLEEPLRFHILATELIAFADTNPEAAFGQALVTSKDYFVNVRPNFIRPVIRKWADKSFSAAQAAVSKLKDAPERRQAAQGLALSKLSQSSHWTDAYTWARKLENSEDRLWASLTLAEMGIYKYPEALGDHIDNFPHQSLKQHLLRCVEAQRIVSKYSQEERFAKTMQLYRSIDPYDYHGRLCVLNTFENVTEREKECFELNSRWRDLGSIAFVSDGFNLCGDVPPGIRQTPLVNLLDQGSSKLDKGDLKGAQADFLSYLHFNPETGDVDPYFTRLSKEDQTWLGQEANTLDNVMVEAADVPEESDLYAVMGDLQKQYEQATGKRLEIYIFEAITGKKPSSLFAWGKHDKTTVREALDTLTYYSGMTIFHKEYGIVGFYYRDEDVGWMMGTPIELIPYSTQ